MILIKKLKMICFILIKYFIILNSVIYAVVIVEIPKENIISEQDYNSKFSFILAEEYLKDSTSTQYSTSTRISVKKTKSTKAKELSLVIQEDKFEVSFNGWIIHLKWLIPSSFLALVTSAVGMACAKKRRKHFKTISGTEEKPTSSTCAIELRNLPSAPASNLIDLSNPISNLNLTIECEKHRLEQQRNNIREIITTN